MQPRSGCAINAAVEALGDNWSVPLLRDIIFGKPHLPARQELMRQQGHAFVEEMDKLRSRHLDQPLSHDDRPLPSERLQAASSAAALDGGTVG